MSCGGQGGNRFHHPMRFAANGEQVRRLGQGLEQQAGARPGRTDDEHRAVEQRIAGGRRRSRPTRHDRRCGVQRRRRGAQIPVHAAFGAERAIEDQGAQAKPQRHLVAQSHAVDAHRLDARPARGQERRILVVRGGVVARAGPKGVPPHPKAVQRPTDRRHPRVAGRSFAEEKAEVIAQLPRRHHRRHVAALISEGRRWPVPRCGQRRRPAGLDLPGRPPLFHQVEEALPADRVGHEVDSCADGVVVHPVQAPGVEDPAFPRRHVHLRIPAKEPDGGLGDDGHVNAHVVAPVIVGVHMGGDLRIARKPASAWPGPRWRPADPGTCIR